MPPENNKNVAQATPKTEVPAIHPDAKPAPKELLQREVKKDNPWLSDEKAGEIAQERLEGKHGEAARYLKQDVGYAGKWRSFTVKSPLLHNGRSYAPGDVVMLSEQEAAAIPPHVLQGKKNNKAEE